MSAERITTGTIAHASPIGSAKSLLVTINQHLPWFLFWRARG